MRKMWEEIAPHCKHLSTKLVICYQSVIFIKRSHGCQKNLKTGKIVQQVMPDLKKLVGNSNEPKLVTSMIMSHNGTSKGLSFENVKKEKCHLKINRK